MLLFNCRLLAEPIFTEMNEKLTLKKNEIRGVIYDKIRLKDLIKKFIGIEEEQVEEFIFDIKKQNG